MSSPDVIPCFSWTASKGRPKAVLLCIHGLGLHGGTYRGFGKQMSKRGIATYALDVRGFGAWHKSESSSVDFPGCLQDIALKIQELRQSHPGLPIFLLGESLGGAISTRFAANFKGAIDGLILCAPARELGDHKLRVLSMALSFLLKPRRRVCIRSAVFSDSPNVVALTQVDKLVRTEFTVSELLHLARFLGGGTRSLSKIDNIPVLFIQGHGDALIKPKSTLEYFERIPSPDKDLVIIGDAQHLIFQNTRPPRKAVVLVENWISDHIAPRPELHQVA